MFTRGLLDDDFDAAAFLAAGFFGELFCDAAFFAGVFFDWAFESAFLAGFFWAGFLLVVFFDAMRETLVGASGVMAEVVWRALRRVVPCWGMDGMTDASYDTPMEKVWLSVKSAMAAKKISVKELGVGEDLSINLLGWRGSQLGVISQLHSNLMGIDPNERFRRVADCAVILRKGFGVDAFTLMAEGYVSSNPEYTRGRPLVESFIEMGSPVMECLTFTHVERDSLMLVTVPYTVTVGRKVNFSKPQIHENTLGLRDAAYPMMFSDILEASEPVEPPVDEDEFYTTLVLGLEEVGFFTMYQG